MTKIKTLLRTRFYFPVEGEGEQSFIKWFQQLCAENGLSVHLDCEVLGGGGYRTMLKKAVRSKKRKNKTPAKSSILLVDGDRAKCGDDGWSISRLKSEASKHTIKVCVQNPNLEGLLLRMMPGNETLQPSAAGAKKQLCHLWCDYKKPMDASALASKFPVNDLLRVAHADSELKMLLSIIGFKLKTHL